MITKDFSLGSMSKMISSETLQNFAESLAALHQPIEINWKLRFGIADNISEPMIIPATVATEPKEVPIVTLPSKMAEAETKPAEAPVEGRSKNGKYGDIRRCGRQQSLLSTETLVLRSLPKKRYPNSRPFLLEQ